MDEYKTLVIILSFLLVGAVAIIVISSDFDNNEVLNPHRSDYQIPEWVKKQRLLVVTGSYYRFRI